MWFIPQWKTLTRDSLYMFTLTTHRISKTLCFIQPIACHCVEIHTKIDYSRAYTFIDGNARYEDIYFNVCSVLLTTWLIHIYSYICFIGHEAKETVWLINNENQSFHFNFDEDSTHSAGYSAHLFVEPMAGTLPARSK